MHQLWEKSNIKKQKDFLHIPLIPQSTHVTKKVRMTLSTLWTTIKKIATVFMCGFPVAASSNQLTPDGAANENIKETIKIYSSHLDDSQSSV